MKMYSRCEHHCVLVKDEKTSREKTQGGNDGERETRGGAAVRSSADIGGGGTLRWTCLHPSDSREITAIDHDPTRTGS